MTGLLALIAVLGVSASGPLMAATSAPALAIAFWRNALGTAVIAPTLLTRRASVTSLSPRLWLLSAAAGAMLAAHFAAWVSALKLTSVAAATALVSTQLIWVVLIDRFRGVRASVAVLTGVATSVAGVLIISGFDFALSTRAITGDLLAILGGLCAAIYLIVGSEIRKKLPTSTYTFICYGFCALFLAVTALSARVPLVGFGARDWLLIGAVTISAQLLGHSLLNHLLAVIGPMVISLILLLEVPGAALLAAVFLGQAPPWGVYAGLATILVGLAVVALHREPAEPVDVVLAE